MPLIRWISFSLTGFGTVSAQITSPIDPPHLHFRF